MKENIWVEGLTIFFFLLFIFKTSVNFDIVSNSIPDKERLEGFRFLLYSVRSIVSPEGSATL